MKYLPLLLVSVMLGQDDDIDLDTVNLDLDALWENTVWEEIQDVTDLYFEVEMVTPVAGVRGAEAEDEALALLYYRKSMKGLTLLDLQKAYGKLINKREKITNPKKLKKIDDLLLQLKSRIKSS
tara:strand:+ start:415 stop:786 length:372 start_codon:yes stop_codon:yes gene_type:complete